MIALTLAWRNLGRHRRRSAIVAGAAAVGALILTLAQGYIGGTAHDMRAAIINSGLGHFQIARTGAFDEFAHNQLDWAMSQAQYRQIQDWASRQNNVSVVAPRLDFGGLISNGPRTVGFAAESVDPAIENRAFSDGDTYVSGHGLTAQSVLGDVVIGQGLAHQLHLQAGSAATLLTTTQSGAINAMDVTIVGVVATGIAERDRALLKTTIATAHSLLATDRIGAVSVLARDDAQVQAVANQARALGPAFDLRSWRRLAPQFDQVIGMFGAVFLFFGVAIAAMSAFAVAGAVLTSVLDRTAEIGVMRALALPSKTIRRMFVAEGALLGALGTAAGIVLGGGAIVVIDHAQLMMPPPPGSTQPYPLYLAWTTGSEIELLLAFALLSVLAAWAVSGRATKLTVLECLAAE